MRRLLWFPGRIEIIVDLPEVAFRLDPTTGRLANSGKTASASASLVKSYRFGQFAPGRSRVVIDLARPAKILRAESVERPQGQRLEIDLAPVDASKFAEAAAEHARAVANTPALPQDAQSKPVLSESRKSELQPLLVIDPGHGGVDVGAASKHGELEKAIVLEFAKTLKTKIEAQGRLRVQLTRGRRCLHRSGRPCALRAATGGRAVYVHPR